MAAFADRDDELEDYLDVATSVSSIGVSRAAQTVPGPSPLGAITTVTFDTLEFSSGEDFTWDGGTLLTTTRAGVVEMTAGASFATNGAGERGMFIERNGVAVRGSLSVPGSVSDWAGSCARKLAAQEGDQFRLRVFQNSGGDLDVSAGLELSYKSALA